MRFLIAFSILCIQLLVSGCESSENISKEDEQAILNISTEVMEASVLGDIPRLLSFLNEDTVIRVIKDGKDPYSYDYDSYKEYLTQVFSMIDGYQYVRTNEKFDMGENGIIILEFDLDETYEFRGETINERHTEAWEIIKVEGSYKILSIIVT